MWNNIAEIIKDTSTKRLALATVFSVLLHAYLVGSFDLRLPSLKNEMHTIEASLQRPKVVLNEIVKEPIVEELIAQEEPVVAPLLQEMTQEPLPATEPQVTDLTAQTLNAAEPIATVTPVETVLSDNVDVAQTEPQPIDAGLVINENAYQYVETEFDVRTEIDGAAEGTAKIVFNLMDGQQYHLTSLIKPQGLAALIVSDLVQTSEGQLTKSGLQPLSYLYQYGNKVDKTYSAKFDWPNKTVNLTTAKGTKIEEITDGTQDLLSFMYQFMYVAPLERMQISIATGKKLATYDYSFGGEESISIPMGELKTIHIIHDNENSDEKTELWLAVDYQYLPVKIRKIEKNGKVYELAAKLITTARPTLN